MFVSIIYSMEFILYGLIKNTFYRKNIAVERREKVGFWGDLAKEVAVGVATAVVDGITQSVYFQSRKEQFDARPGFSSGRYDREFNKYLSNYKVNPMLILIIEWAEMYERFPIIEEHNIDTTKIPLAETPKFHALVTVMEAKGMLKSGAIRESRSITKISCILDEQYWKLLVPPDEECEGNGN